MAEEQRAAVENPDTDQRGESVEGETAIVSCGTTKGTFEAKFHRDWSPHGYDRATALFQKGFFDHSHFFRVVPKFLTQFGISYTDDKSLKQFASTPVEDDPQLEPKIPFTRGTLAFAGSGPNSRTSQMFICYGTNPGLGQELWETPFGEVIDGMEHVEELYSYGDMPPWGKGPVQQKIHNDRNYIPNEFPLLDKFETCTVIIHKPGQPEPEEESDDEKKDNNREEEEEKEENEEATDSAELAARRERVEADIADMEADDPVELEQRELAAAQKELGPFEDLIQVGAVVAAVMIMVLAVATISRKTRTKRHRH